MAYFPGEVLHQYPDESPEEYYDRVKERHNEFANRFNKGILNRIMRNSIPLMPELKDLINERNEKLREEKDNDPYS